MAKVQHKKWLTYLLMAVTVLLLLSATAYAADDTEGRFEVDDNETLYFYQNVGENMPNKQDGFRYEFKYELNQADHTATLVVANSVNSAHYADAELTVLETITYQGTDYTVTTIGEEAFRYSQVKILHLPDTITTIEKGAFIYCYYVEELDIPAGVTSIGENAFWRCHVLKEVVIPQGVTVIPDGAFSQCWAAESLVIPDGVTSIGEYAFQEFGLKTTNTQTLTIPSSVTYIGMQAFRMCNTLTSVTFEEGGTEPLTIDTGFWGCENLESVVFASNLQAFVGPNGTFYNCPKLTSVVLPVGMETIGEYSFVGCSALKEIIVPYTVTSIGDVSFMDVDDDGNGIYAMDKVVYIPDTAVIPENGFYYVTQVFYSVNEDGKTATITSVVGDGVSKLAGNLSGLLVSAVPDAYKAPDKHTHYFGLDGSEAYCSICNTLNPDHEHTWDADYTVDKEPTCTKNGSKSIHCSGCNETKDVQTIPATGHSAGDEWKYNPVNHWKECTRCGTKLDTGTHTFAWVDGQKPTETEGGTRHQECIVCGYATSEVDIPATGSPSGSGSSSDSSQSGSGTDESSSASDSTSGNKPIPDTGASNGLSLCVSLFAAAAAALTGTSVCARKKKGK